MAIELRSLVKVLQDSYGSYYNIITEGLPTDYPLVFKAEYFKNIKKQRLWEKEPRHDCETDEFVYVFSKKSFDEEEIDRCIQYALSEGLSKVTPHKGLKSADVKTIFLANGFTDDALAKIRHNSFKKTYNRSLWGSSSLIACAVDASKEKITANAFGGEMARYFRKLFSAQHRE